MPQTSRGEEFEGIGWCMRL